MVHPGGVAASAAAAAASSTAPSSGNTPRLVAAAGGLAARLMERVPALRRYVPALVTPGPHSQTLAGGTAVFFVTKHTHSDGAKGEPLASNVFPIPPLLKKKKH